jgi:hypothetical protein
MLDENEGANERDGYSCATTMFAFWRVPCSRHVLYYFELGGSSGLHMKIAGSLGHARYHFEMTGKGLVFISRTVLHEDLMKIMRESKAFFSPRFFMFLVMLNLALSELPHRSCRGYSMC